MNDYQICFRRFSRLYTVLSGSSADSPTASLTDKGFSQSLVRCLSRVRALSLSLCLSLSFSLSLSLSREPRTVSYRLRICLVGEEYRRDIASKEQPETFGGLLPESHGQHPAVTVLCVPYSPGSGIGSHLYLTQSVLKVFLHNSIPTQIRQLTLCISNSKG